MRASRRAVSATVHDRAPARPPRQRRRGPRGGRRRRGRLSGRLLGAHARRPCPATGEAVDLHVETQLRAESITLYGFRDPAERAWFRLLQTVQGVGARVALGVLSVLTPDQLARAVAAQDKAALTRASGVGPRLASRIVSRAQGPPGRFSRCRRPRPRPPRSPVAGGRRRRALRPDQPRLRPQRSPRRDRQGRRQPRRAGPGRRPDPHRPQGARPALRSALVWPAACRAAGDAAPAKTLATTDANPANCIASGPVRRRPRRRSARGRWYEDTACTWPSSRSRRLEQARFHSRTQARSRQRAVPFQDEMHRTSLQT